MLRGFPEALAGKAVRVGGAEYFPLDVVADAVGVSRQTLWRWRSDGKVPAGHRLRNRRVLFTRREVTAITDYAFQLEPVELDSTPG